MMPTLFDKLIALLALALAIWSIATFVQAFNTDQSPNYFLIPLAAVAIWLIYWIFSPEKKTADDQAPAPVEIQQIPQLPTKSESSSMYVDDARIVDQINQAIDLANQKKWPESEIVLQGVESVIEDWEPYDTSDAHYEMIWKSAISQIRGYNEYNTSSP